MSGYWKCAWCGRPLTEADRLRYEVSELDFERGDNWRFVLEKSATPEEPIMTCELCRTGIVSNREELERDEVDDKQTHRASDRPPDNLDRRLR